ncbi:hypothetical protein DFH07DRAFT_1055105 [Mycena maculata]|uniref:Hydrophobin n=1 Tax=Mycena maculata TaxID=230809 RepID=A0AAD7KB67_9AGAR|nr:hypothetical protein DFH07DRAFT_1055105 [Mycena maculata]
MFPKLISTAILAILVLGQGAVSVPQAATCGATGDPPCPSGQVCCILPSIPAHPGHSLVRNNSNVTNPGIQIKEELEK